MLGFVCVTIIASISKARLATLLSVIKFRLTANVSILSPTLELK